MTHDISNGKLRELESRIFGSHDKKTGNRFRMRVVPHQNSSLISEWFSLGFKRDGNDVKRNGHASGCLFNVTIMPNNDMTADERAVLLATIWLWANLGAVGARSRRGFGSPFIVPETNHPFGELPIKEKFDNPEELKIHLRDGLKEVFETFISWVNGHGCRAVSASMATIPFKAPYFILRHREQITVGNMPYTDLESVIQAVHGKSRCKGLGYATKTGRMASPVFTRLHKVNNAFFPVAAYCHQGHQGLQNCSAHDCVNAYLKEANFICWLDGTLIA